MKMDFGVTGNFGGRYLAEQYRKNAAAVPLRFMVFHVQQSIHHRVPCLKADIQPFHTLVQIGQVLRRLRG